MGTSWILTERKDPDGFLERLLPGHRIDFERVDLRGMEPGDAAAERRTWELRAEPPRNARLEDSLTDYPRLTLAVYELNGETYEGVAVGLTCDGDTMTLTLGSTITSDGQSVRSDVYRVSGRDAWVSYNRLRTPNVDRTGKTEASDVE